MQKQTRFSLLRNIWDALRGRIGETVRQKKPQAEPQRFVALLQTRQPAAQYTGGLGGFSSLDVRTREQEEQITHISERRHQLRNTHGFCLGVVEHEPLQKKTAGLLPQEACPSCGRMLVVRSGQYGEFIGCSGFPDCRFTKSAGRRKEIAFYPKLGGRSKDYPKLGSRNRKAYPKMCWAKRAKSFPKL